MEMKHYKETYDMKEKKMGEPVTTDINLSQTNCDEYKNIVEHKETD